MGIIDYDDGDYLIGISDNMAIDSDGNMMMRMSNNMAMDMDSGDMHFVSSWDKKEDNFGSSLDDDEDN
jgi:hypothetical protein